MDATEQKTGASNDLREALVTQNKEGLVLLAKKLRLRHARRLQKDQLIEQILLLPAATVRRALNITWWDRWHNHIYGIATILGLILAAVAFLPRGPVGQADQQSDYIEGTTITHAELKAFFPFGYLVVSARDGQWTYTPPPGDWMKYRIPANLIKITPDFLNRTVKWEIPVFSFNSETTSIHIQSDGRFRFEPTFPMKMRTAFVPMFYFKGEPSPHVACLSDNQRLPVFVLGFRIPTGGVAEGVPMP